MMRLRLPALLILLLLCTVAAACGDDDDAGSAASVTTATQAAAAAFPVTIEHKYGTTELEKAPERIVTVGYNEQDTLWALGVAPVGVTDWMGFENGIGPWAEEAAAAAGPKPELLKDTDGIGFEKIAALRPDVIVALYTSLTKADYDKLVQIAPVVAAPKGTPDWGIEWQDTVGILGEVTGKQDEAEKVIADVEAAQAQAKADHPEFAGKTASMAMSLDGMWAYGKDDPRSSCSSRWASSSRPSSSPPSVMTSRPRSAARRPICSTSTRSCGWVARRISTRSPTAASTTAWRCTRRSATSSSRWSGPTRR